MIMGNEEKKCYFTGAVCLPVPLIYGGDCDIYNSILCGQYKFYSEHNDYIRFFEKQKTACYLFYHKVAQDKCYLLFPSTIEHWGFSKDNKYYIGITERDIENWYPKTFAEKADRILLQLAQRSRYDGDQVVLTKQQASLLFFMHNECTSADWELEFYYILKFYVKNGYFDGFEGADFLEYVDAIDDTQNPISITLSSKALDRVSELQKTQSNNKNAFVAMSFHESATEIREAIKLGIENAGYSAELMDEIIHNHQIVPEMLRLILESRFLIMDITQPNFGAYYEAGYAQGLGKEIIVTCQEEVFNQKKYECEFIPKDDKTCWLKEVATKPHFDIAQKQILVWKDYADLTKKLSEWIKFIIG